MKKLLHFSVILIISISTTHAQEVELDLLKAPVSPASNLLGFAQSEIDKPTDVTDFMATIQSASDNFSKLPSNFAIDIAPFWLTKSKSLGDISTVGLQNSYGRNVIPQTLVLSFAVKNVDSTTVNYNANSTYAGFGFKFHIYRGNYDTKTQEKLNQIAKLQQKKLELMKNNSDQVYDNLSEEILELREKREKLFDGIDTDDDSPENLQLIELLSIRAGKIDAEIEEKIEKLLEQNKSTEEVSSLDEKVIAIASNFQLTRIGFTWDFAGGISGEFQNKSFNQGKIYNAGIWTTLGYTTEKAGAFLGLVRYLNNPERIFALDNTINELNSVSTFDMGFRYILGGTQSKFNASLEAVYRSYLSDFEADNSWRLMLNLDYAIVKNQKITFSFGKNYDGTTTTDGNLVAALGTVFGFGNKR
ncbi:MAG: hypothetical protein CVU07_07455 [Bacteroidetes bacterium HGW-Bacteroidetes-23]|nr:MAG: hypothetical protein CVU07_07455 [Bacteroidetes bacterium HGW-Bacteroidetes-23]